MKTIRLTAIPLFLVLICAVHPGLAQWATAQTSDRMLLKRPAVEVMFVLDTTGSMGDLIAAAKEKIWSIANTLATADPAPEIRMGLVGYRDRGDAYVTTYTPLSDDLDAVYSRLIEFQADGGGDTPESVNQALYEAVTKTAWSKNPSTYRVIFLVGDAPPQMAYPDDIKYQRTCALAAGNDITINAIQCGDLAATTPVWQEIARLAEGRFFNVAQSGSAVLYETPFDQPIAELSRTLDDTRIYYGSTEHMDRMAERKARADRIYEAAAPAAVAKRTIFNSQKAGTKNFLGAQELISDFESGAVDLSRIAKDELPASLRGLTRTELKKHIDLQSRQRKHLQSRIEALAQKRQTYIEEKIKTDKDSGTDSLDARMYTCIQTQAGKKGIVYQGGPAY
jgi:Mg-chelatase subunit ChlD